MADTEFQFGIQRVVLDPVAMDKMLNQQTGEVGQYLRKKGILIQAAGRRQVGKRTDRLAESIEIVHGRSSLGQFIQVGSRLDYAFYEHEGTKPHIIRPNNHKFLRFSGGGRVVYTKEVLHPGQKPNRFLSDQLYLVRV